MDEDLDPGFYSEVVNAHGLSSGVYFCRMVADGFVENTEDGAPQVRRANMKAGLVILTLALLLAGVVVIGAQAPSTMGYQGVLKDDLGDNVADGDYDFTFSLYDVSTGGTAPLDGSADALRC